MFKHLILTLLILTIILLHANCATAEEYKAKDFDYLKGALKGISASQIEQHLQLYKGYVKKINELNLKLKKANKESANPTYSEYRSINSSRSFAHNGVVLHELYFSNLTSEKTKPSKELSNKIYEEFGSYKNYLSDLRAAANSARSGWAITAYNCKNKKLYNFVIDEHDLHVPVDIKPILVMDMWEHAYMVDYGINKKSYIEAFIKNINWEEASKRYSSL